MDDRLLIENVRLVDPASRYDDIANIVICGTRFEWVFKNTPSDMIALSKFKKKYPRVTSYNAAGLCAAPGLIDVHCHFRDPGLTHKEDIHTGANAAKKGGFTTVVLMANTSPPIDDLNSLQYVLEKGKTSGIHILSCASVSKGLKGKELTDMEALLDAGAAGFTDDGMPIMDEGLLRAAFDKCADFNVPISLHEEDPLYVDGAGINADFCQNLPKYTPPELYYYIKGRKGADGRAEYSLIERDLKIASKTKATVNFQHLSSMYSVELIRRYLGINCANRRIHAEITPHHFSLTQLNLLTQRTLSKVNPPLRRETDRLALIEALKDGTIDIIASDHAPHTMEEKKRPFFDAPSGMIGLETSFALGITELVCKGHLSLISLIEKMTINPAKLYNLDAGTVTEGKNADLIIFDPAKEWVVDSFVSKSQNSPFVGKIVKGVVLKTICNGKIVYNT